MPNENKKQDETSVAGPFYFVYLMETASGHFYAGISTDPLRRLHEHNTSNRGARALRGQRPVRLVWQFPDALSKGQALKIERKIKRLTHAQKAMLICGEQMTKNIFLS